METNRKNCPYCGEEIAVSAKKCHYCGEWLEMPEAVPVEVVENEYAGYADAPQQLNVNDPAEGNFPETMDNGTSQQVMQQYPQQQYPQQQYPQQQYPQQQYPQQPGQQYYQQPVQPMQPMQPMQQPVINIQVAQETNVSQSQENNQTVVVNGGGSSSSSGFLWFELLAVGGAVWAATGKWWAGVVTWILLAIATQIPVIGTAICIILGCGVGLLAGVIAAAFSAPTWVCWVIGIFVAAGVTGLNLEDKDSDD